MIALDGMLRLMNDPQKSDEAKTQGLTILLHQKMPISMLTEVAALCGMYYGDPEEGVGLDGRRYKKNFIDVAALMMQHWKEGAPEYEGAYGFAIDNDTKTYAYIRRDTAEEKIATRRAERRPF